jgi:hypothetical protein
MLDNYPHAAFLYGNDIRPFYDCNGNRNYLFHHYETIQSCQQDMGAVHMQTPKK